MLQKCCGFNLKTGGLIVAWINIVSSVLVILPSTIVIIYREEIIKFTSSLVPEESKQSMEETKEIGLNILTVLASIAIVVCIVNAIAAALIVVAVKKTRAKLILPWLILNVTALCILIPPFLVIFLVNPSIILQGIIIFDIVAVGVAVYIIYAILSLYKVLKMEEKRKGARDHIEFQGISQT